MTQYNNAVVGDIEEKKNFSRTTLYPHSIKGFEKVERYRRRRRRTDCSEGEYRPMV